MNLQRGAGDMFTISCWNYCKEHGIKPRVRLLRGYAWYKVRRFIYERLGAIELCREIRRTYGKSCRFRSAVKIIKDKNVFLYVGPRIPKPCAFQ